MLMRSPHFEQHQSALEAPLNFPAYENGVRRALITFVQSSYTEASQRRTVRSAEALAMVLPFGAYCTSFTFPCDKGYL